jgi:hypothetical protein
MLIHFTLSKQDGSRWVDPTRHQGDGHILDILFQDFGILRHRDGVKINDGVEDLGFFVEGLKRAARGSVGGGGGGGRM